MQEVKIDERTAKLIAWAEGKELSVILKRVGQFINMAEGSNNCAPDSPEWHALNEEQERARESADILINAYSISEAMRMAAKPSHERIRPIMEYVMEGGGDSGLAGFTSDLIYMVAEFCGVTLRGSRYNREERATERKVWGFEAEVRYFLFLYTTLHLHFVGAIRPKYEPTESIETNAFRLHEAGYNWREIAKMAGWRKAHDWEIPEDWETDHECWTRDSGEGAGEFFWVRTIARKYNLAYQRAAKAQGTEKLKVSASGSRYFRQDAANGYLDRLRQRLREVQAKRMIAAGTAVELRKDDLEQFIRESMGNCVKCPKCDKWSMVDWQCDVCGNTEDMPGVKPEGIKPCERCEKALQEYLAGKRKSPNCRDHTYSMGPMRERNEAGYAAGVRQANTADLGGQRTGASTTKSIN